MAWYGSVISAVAALSVSAGSAAGERLVASLSNYRVQITSNFIGEEIVVFGGIEWDSTSVQRRSGYDIIVTVAGPPQNFITFYRERFFGIWVNADSRVFEDIPSYLAVLSNRPLDTIATAETLTRLQLGLDNFPLPERMATNLINADSQAFRLAIIRSLSERGLYRQESNGVTFLAPALYRVSIPLPSDVFVGSYEVDVRLFADGTQIARTPAPFEVYKSGLEQTITIAVRENGILYGLVTVIIALVTSWLTALVLREV
jgi:uncharacterized protein (TIGR02186 family)